MTMRLFVAFSVLGVFCLPAFSQYGIFADIPFVFGAGERTLAAGRYRLDSATTWSPAVMTVTAVESRERIFLPTSPAGKGAYKAIRKDGA